MALQNTKPVTIAIGVSFCGMTGYMLYRLYQKWKHSDDDGIIGACITKTEDAAYSVVLVPKTCMAMVLGKAGQTLRELESLSSTRIRLGNLDASGQHFECTILGQPEQIVHAQKLIKSVIKERSLWAEEALWVPKQTVGKIIGKGGSTMQKITELSNAHIQVVDGNPAQGNSMRKINIRGTAEQVSLATCYINTLVGRIQEVDTFLARREPRSHSTPNGNGRTASQRDSHTVEQLATVSGHSDSPFEVYISAMVDPSRFWVQIVGPKAKELDLLVEEMTEYYENADNLELHKLEDIAVGDLVAATFKYDNKWYRAEVLSLQEGNQHAELYYADYGDTEIVAVTALFELRTDFLRLHFQAIECYLARVEPLGGEWSEEAVDKFEEWTYVAQWHKLSAKVNEYCVRDKTRAKREGSPVPGVELFDVANEYDIDISQELVRHGYAVYRKDASGPNSRATSATQPRSPAC